MSLLEKIENNRQIAERMYSLYSTHADEDGNLPTQGYTAIKGVFSEVEEDDKVDVYIMFVQYLELNNVKYNPEQFQ